MVDKPSERLGPAKLKNLAHPDPPDKQEEDWGYPDEQHVERDIRAAEQERCPWEVKDNHADMLRGEAMRLTVERGVGSLREVAAYGITDYGVACVLEAALNLRDGTVE